MFVYLSFSVSFSFQRIAYAKSISHATMKENGTFKIRRINESAAVTSQIMAARAQAEAEEPSMMTVDEPSYSDGEGTILFVENLPAVNEDMKAFLHAHFNQYPGLRDVRLIPGRADIAFVEYQMAEQASKAKLELQDFDLGGGNKIKLSFAKKK